MSIFDKLKIEQKNNKTTRGFYFGHTEAEGENKEGIQNLNNYFEDYLNVLPQIMNEKFIIIGRKGSGKSAIAKFLKDSCDKEDDSFADIVKFNDIELEKVVQHIPIEERNNIELVIFEWLILVRLIRLLVNSNHGIYTSEFKKFKEFLHRNAGFAEIDKYHIHEIVEKKKLEISIEILKRIHGPIIGRYLDSKKIKAPFYQFVNPLKEIIGKVIHYDVFKDKTFLILFDDLDIKFRADNEEAKEKLLSLLRAVKNMNTTIFRGTQTKVLILLRDDIKNIIETKDSDTSKIFSSYDLTLNWYDHQNFKLNENQVYLKQFANKRIGLNFKSHNVTHNTLDPWCSLFANDNYAYNNKSSFKYFIDYTFYRPRDIVLFLSEIGNNDYSYPINSQIFKVLIQKFIRANVKEIKSELSIYFTEEEISKLIDALKQLCNIGTMITKDEALTIFEKTLPSQEPMKILELLLEYSILILKDFEDKLYFNYRDNSIETIDFNKMKLTTHKSIYNYFYPNR